MSHFNMCVLTKANLKLYDGNMGHDLVIGIVLCYLTNRPIIYTSGQFYLCLDHPSNKISLGALKCYVGFKKYNYEPFNIVIFLP